MQKTDSESLKRLPLWARERIPQLEREITRLERENGALKKEANANCEPGIRISPMGSRGYEDGGAFGIPRHSRVVFQLTDHPSYHPGWIDASLKDGGKHLSLYTGGGSLIVDMRESSSNVVAVRFAPHRYDYEYRKGEE
jgi:hypothetical protein